MAQARKEAAATTSELKDDLTALRGTVNLLIGEKKAIEDRAVRAEQRVAEAKVIIASLSEQVAELKGYVRRTHEFEDARSDMVPDVPVHEAPLTKVARDGGHRRPPPDGDRGGERQWVSVADRPPPKHWTAL